MVSARSARLLDGLLAGAVFLVLMAGLATALACYLTSRCKHLRVRAATWCSRSRTEARHEGDSRVWHSMTTTFINRAASNVGSTNSANIRSPDDGFVNPGFEDFVH